MTERVPTKEFRRKERVIDQAMTGQATLRDQYRARALALRLAILGLSIVATLFALVNGDTRIRLHPVDVALQPLLAVATGLIFFLTLVDLLTDWSGRSSAYGEGVRRLSEVKRLFRGVTLDGEFLDAPDGLTASYDRAMETVPVIPESQFLKIKVRHQRKEAISRLLDSHPGAPLPYVYLLSILRGVRGVGSTGHPREDAMEPDPK